MHRGYGTFVATVCYLLCGLNAPAIADDEVDRADALSKEAAEFVEKGKFAKARKLYEEALALDPQPRRECNVGSAYFKLKQWPQAHFFLGTCLSHTTALPADFVAQISEAHSFVDKTLQEGGFTLVHFKTSPVRAELHLPGLAPSARFQTPRRVWLGRGKHVAEATAPDFEDIMLNFTVARDAEQTITLTFDPKLGSHSEAVETSETLSVVKPSPLAAPSSRVPALVSFAVGAVSLSGGILFHVSAAGKRADLEAPNSDETRRALISDLKTDRLVMAGFYGASAVAIGVGTWLWIRSSQEQAGPQVSASVAGGRTDVWLRWPM